MKKEGKRNLFIIGSCYSVLFLGIFVFYLVNPFGNECVAGNCFNSFGIYVHHSGIRYEGEWKNGMRHGKGMLRNFNIYAYTGEWRNNKMDGHGTMVNSWSKYVGEWKSGNKNGKGTYWFNAKEYEGHWKNGLKHGSGTLNYPGGFKWIGEWKDNRMYSGKGTIVSKNGNRYDGQMNNGNMYGTITITYPDGSKFKGDLVSGEKNIQGTAIYPDGSNNHNTVAYEEILFNLE